MHASTRIRTLGRKILHMHMEQKFIFFLKALIKVKEHSMKKQKFATPSGSVQGGVTVPATISKPREPPTNSKK